TVTGGATIQSLLSNIESLSLKQNILGIDESSLNSEGNMGAGINYIYSDNLKIIQLPLSYSISDEYVAGMTIPYVYKKKKGYFQDEELKNEGSGDVSVYLENIITEEKYRLSSTLTVKIPTGFYKMYDDNVEKLPLGTGSYDLIWGEYLVYKPGIYKDIRLTASFSYRFNRSSSYREEATFNGYTGIYNFENTNGNVLNLTLGTIYFSGIENLLFYGDFSYLNIQRGTIGYSNDLSTVNVST
ncbi:MAG: hypothetical protein GY756_02780, partial [bacterium]|nr:hypothetical protein [bacterium]